MGDITPIQDRNQQMFKRYPDTEQFKNCVKQVYEKTTFAGLAPDGTVLRNHNAAMPKIKFVGTVKCHGTQAAILARRGTEEIQCQSRENILTLLKDNAGFAMFVNSVGHKRLSDYALGMFPEANEVATYGEWAGCFYYDTPVLLADGSVRKIGLIVNGKENVEVMSYNFEQGRMESKRVVGWKKGPQTDDWLCIEPRRRKKGGKSTRMIVTPNHIVYSKVGGVLTEVRADALKEGDTLFIPQSRAPFVVSQFIKGSLLGDGSFIGKSAFQTCHSITKQRFYLNFIERLLGPYILDKTDSISGFGAKMRTFRTRSLLEIRDMYDESHLSDNGKQVTTDFLNTMSPLALAAWYMDDGTFVREQNGRRYKCQLCTQGFSDESNSIIKEWMDTRGYFCVLTKYVKTDSTTSFFITFTPEGALSFLSTIAPFVLKGFNYKLPEHLRHSGKFDWFSETEENSGELVETVVKSISRGNPYGRDGWKKSRYDIEVEGNHNYFASNVLVHNSNIQKGVGISGLPKMFVVFGLLVDDVWQKPDVVKNFKLPDAQIFNIFDYRTFEIEIDFADPEPFRNTIVDWVLEVERECPVAKAFGNTGIGEGIVFKSYDEPWNESRFWFKAKGEKHSATKTKVLLPIDTEKHASVKAFAESVMTDSRYEQAIQAVKLELGRDTLENGDFGKVLAWLNRDIVKEESDGIAACGATDFKEVVPHIARMARQKFFGGAS